MFQDNPLLAQLKQQIKETIPKKEGIIKATERGFGFLEVDNKTRYFIPPPYMKKCLHGDKVVALIRTENDKEVAEPDQLVEQNLDRFIGRIKMIKGRLNVVADKAQFKNITFKARTKKGLNPQQLNDGDWVVVHLIQHALSDNKGFLVEINSKITDGDDKIAPWWVTLAENDLPNCEPAGIDEWQQVDDENLERIDLTDVPFVTIDGESTKDMDDALYAEQLESGDFKLMIAIADPTAYIPADSEMDEVARKRGFTIYLPGRNIPMLPRELADELCSLVEKQTRLALCCAVTISKDGVIQDDISFFAARIQSHARLVYDHVSDWLENGSSPNWQPDSTEAKVINDLSAVAAARANWRKNNAVVFQDRPDYRFELSDDNDVIAIHTEIRRTANKIVEECMITANICAGIILKQQFSTGIFNTHSGFKTEKLKDVVQLINSELSHSDDEHHFTEEKLTTLEGFSALRRWLTTQKTAYLDNRLRKSQAYSEISTAPSEHYAMGLEIYATWTSPIRKYSDMINHRLLKAHILGVSPTITLESNIGEELALIRKHHKFAERNVSDWLYARSLVNEPQKATKYSGEIFDINRAGVRVRIIENGATAFIPSSLIVADKERINFNSELGIVSIDDDHVYKLGDVLEIILSDVNIESRNIVAKPVQQFG
ncbi:exoribonuclease II [Vibrio sp. TH_r3]|uniref:exoribonuclease II n=1 Tax=Vibrio sp. TH_r3 TaxID=3082084 RepID=UPI00295340D3|nr:exoribonuclease II [Vibrio sp. TH_r3]MDV7103567.1 exoribonuclease II [Vibrio sp. TH_r3]